MKRFAQVSLIAALALSSIPTVSSAGPRFYRETVYYNTVYSAPPSPIPHDPSPMPSEGNRIAVGWDRYYCDGSVRSYGQQTGDFEDYEIGTCD